MLFKTKILVAFVIIFFVKTFIIHAQNADYLWKQVQTAVQNNEIQSLKSYGKELLCDKSATDTQLLTVWKLCSSIAIDEQNLQDVWDCYYWFDKTYGSNAVISTKFAETEELLRTTYYELVAKDMEQPISTGIYVSAGMDKKGKPRLIMFIDICDNTYRVTLPKGSSIADNIAKYGIGTSTFSPSRIGNPVNVKDDGWFISYWGKTSTHIGNQDAAKSAIESAYNIRRDTEAELNSGRYTLKETIAATAASTLASGIMTGIGSLLAKGTTTNRSYELLWTPYFDGMIQVTLKQTRTKESTTGKFKEDTHTDKEILYKLYPHMAVMFYLADDVFISSREYKWKKFKKKKDIDEQFCNKIFFDPAWDMVNALIPNINKNKMKKMNQVMYKYFLRDVVFKDLKRDTLNRFMPNLEQMYYVYTPYSQGHGFHLDWGVLKNKNTWNKDLFFAQMGQHYEGSYVSFNNSYGIEAQYVHHFEDPNIPIVLLIIPREDGTYEYEKTYKNGESFKGIAEKGDYGIYLKEGIKHINEYWWYKGSFTGINSLYNTGVETYIGSNYRTEIKFNEGMVTEKRVIFANGDVFIGEIDDEYKAHGEGILIHDNGIIDSKCVFEHGVKKVLKSAVTRSKKNNIKNKRNVLKR